MRKGVVMSVDNVTIKEGNMQKLKFIATSLVSAFCLAGAVDVWGGSVRRLGNVVDANANGIDAMTTPLPSDSRLEGSLAVKVDRFFANRITDDYLRDSIFEEARRAFAFRDDDEEPWNGQWRGEFWGKSMLSAVRVADYLGDGRLRRSLLDEARRLVALRDGNGYLGSYSERTNCVTTSAQRKAHGGGCTNWNLWNRKYVIWALEALYRSTGEKWVLDEAAREMKDFIAVVDECGYDLADTGHYTLSGIPTMSVLKPLLWLYVDTRDEAFLAFARRVVAGWDRADGRAPNFFRNLGCGRPFYAWYAKPESWCKTYEMLSCLDGLLEYYRVTGDRRSLETVVAIRDDLMKHDSNQIGGLGVADRLLGAERFAFCSTEVCDVIHWMRLNVDLYLITGEDRYLDSVEFSYFNAMLASVNRDGTWGAMIVRDAGRHVFSKGQCGYAYHHCCLDNIPRAFMDVASVAVTKDDAGTYHVNLFQDATVTVDGVVFTIRGDYPAKNRVTVRTSKPVKVAFRKPGWCPRLDMDSRKDGDGELHTLVFDMNARIVERSLARGVTEERDEAATLSWGATRHQFVVDVDLKATLPEKPYATVQYGPLVLAKCARLGARKPELKDMATVNGLGYSVRLKPLEECGVYAPFEVELTAPGRPTVKTRACAYEAASDDPAAKNGYVFSIRF